MINSFFMQAFKAMEVRLSEAEADRDSARNTIEVERSVNRLKISQLEKDLEGAQEDADFRNPLNLL